MQEGQVGPATAPLGAEEGGACDGTERVEVEDDGQLEEEPAFRLTSLPPGLLWHVVRRMGRRSRIVSRALLDAYGPLDCGLQLTVRKAHKELMRMLLSGSGERLQRISSLELSEQLNEVPPPKDCLAELTAAVAHTFPRLTSLALGFHLEDTEIANLAPLYPTLTSLHLNLKHLPMDPAALLSLQQLTNLRSLTLGGAYPHGPEERLALQQALARMPRLQHLSWFARCYGTWCPQWLPALAPSVPHLTSLALGCLDASERWDQRTTEAVTRHLPALRSLSAAVWSPLWSRQSMVAPVAALLAGLSHCSGVGDLHLRLNVNLSHPSPNLRQLAGVQLASLHAAVLLASVPSQAEPLMHALRAQSRLTELELKYLSVAGVGRHLLPPPALLPASLVQLRLKGDWQPAQWLPCIQQLPCLRGLTLSHDLGSIACWSDEAAGQLSTLTQLHSLTITEHASPAGLLAALSGLTALQELSLLVTAPDKGWPRSCFTSYRPSHATDEDLACLAVPFRERLTSLRLEAMHEVSAPGLAALLGALTSLRRLELTDLGRVMDSQDSGEVLVQHLLPSVPHLSHLGLGLVQLPPHSRDKLLQAAAAWGCRCELT